VVAFLCFLSLAKQRKEVAVGPHPTYKPFSNPKPKTINPKNKTSNQTKNNLKT
jgi:hypothetical protein